MQHTKPHQIRHIPIAHHPDQWIKNQQNENDYSIYFQFIKSHKFNQSKSYSCGCNCSQKGEAQCHGIEHCMDTLQQGHKNGITREMRFVVYDIKLSGRKGKTQTVNVFDVINGRRKSRCSDNQKNHQNGPPIDGRRRLFKQLSQDSRVSSHVIAFLMWSWM